MLPRGTWGRTCRETDQMSATRDVAAGNLESYLPGDGPNVSNQGCCRGELGVVPAGRRTKCQQPGMLPRGTWGRTCRETDQMSATRDVAAGNLGSYLPGDGPNVSNQGCCRGELGVVPAGRRTKCQQPGMLPRGTWSRTCRETDQMSATRDVAAGNLGSYLPGDGPNVSNQGCCRGELGVVPAGRRTKCQQPGMLPRGTWGRTCRETDQMSATRDVAAGNLESYLPGDGPNVSNQGCCRGELGVVPAGRRTKCQQPGMLPRGTWSRTCRETDQMSATRDVAAGNLESYLPGDGPNVSNQGCCRGELGVVPAGRRTKCQQPGMLPRGTWGRTCREMDQVSQPGMLQWES
ncbi:uncharacterized protein LOC110676611 [Aedes aegypti]|uniref:Uncharacterized protein n=1 Tax=Aedes aegypti TaxID=7159 RepID=A0A6I8TQ43_AEDAE|nr:uncharacterized protein LOC110676611 [Aedes aegypti]